MWKGFLDWETKRKSCPLIKLEAQTDDWGKIEWVQEEIESLWGIKEWTEGVNSYFIKIIEQEE